MNTINSPTIKKETFSIRPLGGLGQIGSNFLLIQDHSINVLIDCGILFPYEDFFNIDYLVPSLESIEKLDYLLITHGHEDHIGAISHVLTKFPNVSVYAPLFAEKLIHRKLSRCNMSCDVNRYDDRQEINIGEFSFIPIRVNHSIPDTYAFFINHQKSKSSVFFASDFKIDANPIFEPPFRFEDFESIMEGHTKRIVFSDSTNILSAAAKTPSESLVQKNLEEIVTTTDGRIFVTCFASNIFRSKSILQAAKKSGRKVFLLGRAIEDYIGIASEVGLITSSERDCLTQDQSEKGLIILVSGSQGEFRSQLRAIASGESSLFKLSKKDTIVFSSKPIPGNEKRISQIYNLLSDIGVEIITSYDRPVHTSGHAGRDDLKELYELVRPTLVIPVHGELFFLRRHNQFISKLGYTPLEKPLLNNHSLLISKENVEHFKSPPIEPTIYHARGKVLERTAISERRKLATMGLIVASFQVSGRGWTFDLTIKGLPIIADEHLPELSTQISALIQKQKSLNPEELRIFIRREMSNLLGYKPITIVHVPKK